MVAAIDQSDWKHGCSRLTYKHSYHSCHRVTRASKRLWTSGCKLYRRYYPSGFSQPRASVHLCLHPALAPYLQIEMVGIKMTETGTLQAPRFLWMSKHVILPTVNMFHNSGTHDDATTTTTTPPQTNAVCKTKGFVVEFYFISAIVLFPYFPFLPFFVPCLPVVPLLPPNRSPSACTNFMWSP